MNNSIVHRLMSIPEIARQPAHRKTVVLGLIERGADAALLLFWHNLITGAYSHFPIAMVMKDVMHYIEIYPQFEADILNWFVTFESLPKS